MDSNAVFRLSGARRYHSAVDEWLASEPQALFVLARHWFNAFRACGEDVTELIHDGCPVACVGDAAFGYVNVFKQHVNVGFYHGASLQDPEQLLEGTGKRMRHVKLRPGDGRDLPALAGLIETAYRDIKTRLR